MHGAYHRVRRVHVNAMPHMRARTPTCTRACAAGWAGVQSGVYGGGDPVAFVSLCYRWHLIQWITAFQCVLLRSSFSDGSQARKIKALRATDAEVNNNNMESIPEGLAINLHFPNRSLGLLSTGCRRHQSNRRGRHRHKPRLQLETEDDYASEDAGSGSGSTRGNRVGANR